MTPDAASLAADVHALALLDELLAMPAPVRRARLETLAGPSPALHARLLGLLAESERTDDSALLACLQPAHRAALPGALVGPALQPGALLAGYRLLRELGRGGMSVVWLAERADGVVKREVALKLPLQTSAVCGLNERFARERDVLASLSHPHIARLYDAGVAAGGQPFIALERIAGLSIEAHCSAKALPVEARVRLFLQVISAVAHAHKHLVVHRDLKPSNILVDASGQAKLLDFGIAKLLGDAESGLAALTRQGGCALTLRYAAPEQICQGVISTATDIYALGVLLYELLAGISPYAQCASSTGGLVHAVLHMAPVAPSRIAAPGAPTARRGFAGRGRRRGASNGDLDTVVLKALCKAPADRYASVEHFGEDLQRWLALQPIAARRPSWLHRLRLFTRRHRGASIGAALAVAGGVLLGAVALQQHADAMTQAARATAVSGFLSDLVSDAEADEPVAGHEVTGKDMVDAASERARRDFGDRPRLEGELLGELGRMYARLDEPAKSVATLEQALALLEAQAPAGDPALNKVRAQLAAQLLAQGQEARAERLAQASLDACRGADRECAKARGYAQESLDLFESGRGHPEAALVHARQAVLEMTRGFGAANADTVDTLDRLAVMARNAGRLEEAVAAQERALALGEHVALRAADRIRMQRTQALLQFDLGHYGTAQTQFDALLQHTQEAAERALQFRLLSNTLAAAGEPALARAAAESALALAEPGPLTPASVFALQARARALMLLDLYADARRDLQAVIERLPQLGYGADSLEMLRARRLHGELRLRAGEIDAARQELDAVAQALAAHASGSLGIERAQALELLGCLWRDAGDAPQAAALHAQAQHLLEKNLPADHPFLARNTLYQAVAAAHAPDQPGARARVPEQAALYARRFGTQSLWARTLERSLATPACVGPASAPCALIL